MDKAVKEKQQHKKVQTNFPIREKLHDVIPTSRDDLPASSSWVAGVSAGRVG